MPLLLLRGQTIETVEQSVSPMMVMVMVAMRAIVAIGWSIVSRCCIVSRRSVILRCYINGWRGIIAITPIPMMMVTTMPVMLRTEFGGIRKLCLGPRLVVSGS